MAAPAIDIKINIKASDMDDDLIRKLNEVVIDALKQFKTEKQIAHHIKYEFDKSAGFGWNCIVGRNFGSHIKHQTNRYVFFSIRELNVLLWKASLATGI